MMNTDYLPKGHHELFEQARLLGQKEIIDKLDELFEDDAFEEFYKSPASLVLSPWFDKEKKRINEELGKLDEPIKQKYEL